MTKLTILPARANILENNLLYSLPYDISREFENKVKITIGPAIDSDLDPEFQSAYDDDRNQYNSTKLLYWFLKKFSPTREEKILGILDLDAYSNGLNFVFGEAFQNGTIAVIYLPRIKQEFYGLKSNESLFFQRMIKEAVHELGHAFGLTHCNNKICVMHFSSALNDTDIKDRRFCNNCRNTLF
jgi:archaemetzincin